jgi:hypothetical protein
VSFRLMPRFDRDVFAVTAPAAGAFVVEVVADGGHRRLHLTWLDAGGTPRGLEADRSVTVRAGETLYAEFRSAAYSGDEVGRVDRVAVRVRHRRLDGTWSEEAPPFGRVVAVPWRPVLVPPTVPVPVLEVTAPQPGLYRVVADGPRAVATGWRASDDAPERETTWERLAMGDRRLVTVVDAATGEAITGPLTLRLELRALAWDDPPGPYPRLAPVLELTAPQEVDHATP